MLDTKEGTLSKEGDACKLGATEFRVLEALVERQGAIITKDELISRVWGKSPINDNALHMHITALREILGDDVISTKRGAGYSIIPEVSREHRKTPAGNVAPGVEGRARLVPLIGRQNELNHVVEFLGNDQACHATGPGGVGKTSLGLHVAQESAHKFADGVWFAGIALPPKGTRVEKWARITFR